MPAGRPLKFKTVKLLEKKIQEYFDGCFEPVMVKISTKGKGKKKETWEPQLDHNGNQLYKRIKPFTITGLALALDTSRRVLIEYGEKEEFSNTIKRAKQTVENYTEEELFRDKNVTGVIFNLKNNYNWKDKQEIEHDMPKTLIELFKNHGDKGKSSSDTSG